MLDRPALLVGQPGGSIAGAALNGGVLPIYGALDMPAIDAMTMRLVHPLRALDHAGFDLDHPTAEEQAAGLLPFDGWAVNTRCLEGFDPASVPVRMIYGSRLAVER